MHFAFARSGIFVAIIAHGLIGVTLVWDKVLLRQPDRAAGERLRSGKLAILTTEAVRRRTLPELQPSNAALRRPLSGHT